MTKLAHELQRTGNDHDLRVVWESPVSDSTATLAADTGPNTS